MLITTITGSGHHYQGVVHGTATLIKQVGLNSSWSGWKALECDCYLVEKVGP